VSARWYKRCGADFIHGTMMLTLEEKGAYSLCLDLIYDRGGPIPDDARWLSGVCGVSMRKWGAIRARLIELGKLAAADNHLSNSRAALELVSAELSHRERAESGAKGGRKRAEKAGTHGKINGLAQAELKPKEEIREEEKPPSPPPPTESIEVRPEHVLEAFNAMADRNGLPKAKMTAERRRKLRAFVRRHPIDDITEAISAIERSPFCRGENDRGWKANFDFLLQPTSFTRLTEGTYDRP
jgi:uncharacterized protein YdaU (DUF1376 family)